MKGNFIFLFTMQYWKAFQQFWNMVVLLSFYWLSVLFTQYWVGFVWFSRGEQGDLSLSMNDFWPSSAIASYLVKTCLKIQIFKFNYPTFQLHETFQINQVSIYGTSQFAKFASLRWVSFKSWKSAGKFKCHRFNHRRLNI